jgi:site-specific recombinase XerD
MLIILIYENIHTQLIGANIMGYLQNNMIEEMKLRGYSNTTIKMYTKCIHNLAYHYNKSPLNITQIEIRDFFVMMIDKGLSQMNLHIYYSAIKVFYKIHGQPHYIDFLPHPKRPFTIPEVLDESEIQNILSLCRTLRYKLFFTLIYSSGLRISEALNLKITDIDTVRKTIHIKSSKNMKDRYTILSEKAIIMLKHYINRYKPESLLFFTLSDKSQKMPKRYCQQIFHNLVKEAHITKRVHVHTLRHSFATHLLEHDTNIFYIMKLLGHSCISTTIIYLHMQRLDKMNIRSPLDLSSISLEDFIDPIGQQSLCIA